LVQFTERLPSIKQATEMLIDEALRRSRGNQSLAADLLGISHQALSKRLQRRKARGG
jgi:DNA-binding protein Fis